MKRKIVAILAADMVGYCKLVSDDEEDAVRRLSSCRAVFEDFVSRFHGRIFNTAGDSILVEFSSAVEALRCAIEVQESLRNRNLGYLPSREMSFRIGVTIGDVIEREGDMLGNGVNIAARLESLAPPGGICVSRDVYEQVSSKLSIKFVDIGVRAVKNISQPIHAYILALGPEDECFSKTQQEGTGGIMTTRLAATAGVALVAAVAFLSAVVLQTDAPQGMGWQPQRSASCAQIRLACENAGFHRGAGRDGNGLAIDCIRPIMQATPQRPNASKPLPQIDPQIVADCKAQNPSFGQTKKSTSQISQ